MIKEDTSDLKYKYLGKGVFGKCYLTPGRMVYKEFNFKLPDKIYDNITRISQIENDSFVLPSILVYKNQVSIDDFLGYIMRYSKGIDFNHIFESTEMEKFILALVKLEIDMKKLSEEKFQIYDFKAANVLYTKDDKIDVLDPDLYVYNDALNAEDVLKCNLMELEYLLDSAFIKQNPRKFKSDKLRELYNTFSYGKLLGSYYIYEIMKEIERVSKEEVKTYGDFNQGLRLILK